MKIVKELVQIFSVLLVLLLPLSVMIEQGICAENVYVDSNAVEGVSFIADTTGTFRFTIASGAYSCWPSSHPDIGWYSGVIVYKNRSIDWQPYPGSPDTFYAAGADFVIGNTGTKYPDYASAESSGVGSYVDIPMNAGDYLVILTPDGKCGIVDNPQDECGYGDNQGGIYLSVFEVELPTVEITEVRMVSPSILGIDATVSFPDYDPKEGPRYVELRATINGQPIKEQIDVTDLVGPGETTLIEWVHTKRVYTKGLQIDLANTRDESGNPVEIPRFIKNEKFNLEAVAWSSTSGRSEVATKEVNILLPVIIVHGWTGESLVASIPFRIYESLIARLTGEGYTTDPSWYKTIWFERYSSQTWSPQRVAYWLDGIVGKAIKATYADRVNIIGHSLGGLVGRYYITEHNGASKVHKLIMVGTPNKGSSRFYTAKEINGKDFRIVDKVINNSPLSKWLIPTYEDLYAINGTPLERKINNNFPDKPPYMGVTYYSIYNTAISTPYGITVKPYRGWYDTQNLFYNPPGGEGGDGVVAWNSAYLDGATNIPLIISSGLTSGHGLLPKNPNVQNTIIENLED
jgi:pimeloyl-ACP methyl ester carboxylesterase